MTKDSKTQPLQGGTLLILGSAPEVVSIADQKLPAGCDLLAVNNAWRVHPETRHLIIPGDFPEKDLPPVERGMNIIRGQQSSRASWNAGGHLLCGTTMVFLAGYFAIWAFKQRQINIFGCNMMYEGKRDTFLWFGKSRSVDRRYLYISWKTQTFGKISSPIRLWGHTKQVGLKCQCPTRQPAISTTNAQRAINR